MKKFLYFLLLVILLLITIQHKNEIIKYIMINFIEKNISFKEPNEYYKNYDYEYVQNTDNLYPQNKQDILNIIYTTLNIGSNNTIFYCNYDKCLEDVNEIAENKEQLSAINNIVHPYNSYKNIYFTINDYDRIEINIKKQYSDSEILLINNRINNIINELQIENLNDYNKIKAFHDYIINNTKYDDTVSIESQLYTDTNSNKATGLLFEKKAVCSGYSDTMAIFLNKYGFNNYKISSDDHIWNLIYIDNTWKHIDATWDDPVSSNGRDILIHDFFMIDTNTLINKDKELEKTNHDYDKNIYKEANQHS